MTKRKVKKVNKTKETGLTKKKKQIIAVIVLLLLVIGGGISYKIYQDNNKAELTAGNFLPEGKDAKKMSKKELEKAAQEAVDDSQFTLNILPEASFPDGKSSGSIYIKNPATNAYPISVEVIDEDTGDIIYESGAIQPGEEITEGTLSKDLGKGEYTCTAQVSIYDAKTKELKGQTAAEMVVEVKS